MPRRPNTRPRVLGPYQNGDRWQIVIIDPNAADPQDRRVTRDAISKEDAEEAKGKIEKRWSQLDASTIGPAIDQYKEHLQSEGTGERSYNETIRRLKLFFPDHDARVSLLDADKCADLYDAFVARKRPDGKPISVDYHRNTLSESRSFLEWCVEQEWLKSNPLAKVKGRGKRKKGKPQWTADEATKFNAWATFKARNGDSGALGVLIALLCGFRNSEVWKRQVRDLDRGGTVLNVPDTKTEKGKRVVEVPVLLQEPLKKIAEGKGPFDLLFGHHTNSWLRSALKRLCKQAGVPYIPPHGCRGTNGTMAATVHGLSQAVADYLGHESVRTTAEHYVRSEVVDQARQETAMKVIQGGRR